MKRINVGLIGGGFMGKAHSLAYSAVPMFFWPSEIMPVKHTVAEFTDDSGSLAALQFDVRYPDGNGGWLGSAGSVLCAPRVDIALAPSNHRGGGWPSAPLIHPA